MRDVLAGIAGAGILIGLAFLFGQPRGYHWDLPAGIPLPSVPADNPMSDVKVTLGRRLFYDQRLSVNETMSCGTCHMQRFAFTDAKPVAVGALRFSRALKLQQRMWWRWFMPIRA